MKTKWWIILFSFVFCIGLTIGGSCDGDDDDEHATGDLVAGFRASRYGISPFPAPEYWEGVGRDMAEHFDRAAPGGLWIVGVADDEGGCDLNFPSPGGEFADISFQDEDENAAYLDWFDAHGLSVWLQVEPGEADVAALIELVLDRYGDHPCVAGFGVDVEWHRWTENADGLAVSDAQAQAWSEQVRAYDGGYTLYLKHWLPERMPATYREGLAFVDDSQQFSSLDELVAEFADWGEHFAPAPVMYQFGYEDDGAWWRDLADPPVDIGEAILSAVPNTAGLFWVDFTLAEVFP
ncbi:MAG TPA: hypothetical protein PK961_09285 [bacterium]|nr:hypothetical protein [bacterium]